MGRNPNESFYKLGKDVSGPGRDRAVLPIKEKRFLLPSKDTGLYLDVKRADPNANRGPFGGVVYVAAVHGGSTDKTGPHLKRRDGDPKIGTNKARNAQRAGRRLGEQWLAKTSDKAIQAMIQDRRPNVYGGRK